MQKNIFILFISCFLLTSLFSQDTCQQNLLIGEWKYVTSFSERPFKIDSLKKIIPDSTKPVASWSVLSTGECTWKYGKHIYTKPYMLDSSKCEFTIGRKRRDGESTCHILYLDEHYLIYSQPRPQIDFIYVYYR